MKKYIVKSNGKYATFEYREPFTFFSSSPDKSEAMLYTLEQAKKIQNNWGHHTIEIFSATLDMVM